MERRTFLKFLTHGLGVTFAAALGFPAIAYLIDPRHRKATPSRFRTVARLSELTEVDVPVQAVIRETRRDSFTMYPNELVGRVYLIPREGGAVDAFTMECPHLGCALNLDDDKKGFTCPCHDAKYDLQGKRLSGPAPRGMDSLPCRLVPADEAGSDTLVQVEFMKFVNNRPEKIVRS